VRSAARLPPIVLSFALLAGCGGSGGDRISSETPPKPPAAASEELTPPADLQASGQVTAGTLVPVPNRTAAGPNVSVTVEPNEGGNLVYLQIAGATSNAAKQGQLSVRLLIKNNGASTISLNKVTLTFAGPPAVSSVAIPVTTLEGRDPPSRTIAAGTTAGWHFETANNVILPQPAPASVEIAMAFDGLDPAKVTCTLVKHTSQAPGGYQFPARASELRIGEYWSARSNSHAPAGDGGQLFAYDMGVIAWDGNAWSGLLPGGSSSKNEDYRIWGKPVRAMANGTVVSFLDTQLTNPSPPAKPYNNPVEGNHFYIQTGNELVLYAHLQKGTLPANLKQVGAVVHTGDLLGLAGNSGNSTGPHLHIHAIRATQAWGGSTRPLPFKNAWAIDRSVLAPPDPAGSWTLLSALGPPTAAAAIWPAATAPTWYPPGYGEIAKHGIPASSYQTEFTRITSSGYRPVWVDGFEVAGQTYYNAIFRPNDGVGWSARHGMTSAQYQAEFDSQVQAGRRLLHIDSYASGGGVRYASIFVSGGGPPWLAYHGRTGADHQALFNQRTAEGWRPVIISVASVGGDRRYTALYEKKSVGSYFTLSGLTSAQYQTAFNENAAAGRKLVYVNGFTEAGQIRFTAIWHSAPAGWPYARHNLTSSQYQTEFNSQLGQGRLTRAVTGYEYGGQAYYAAFWK